MALGTTPGLEDFQILQELSSERGNKVYLARSKGEKVVAIKVLAAQPINEDARNALSKEASLTARLTHDTIIQTRSIVMKDDFVAVVNEFIPGVSLQRLVRFATGRGVRLPDVCAYYVFERVLSALASAHGGAGDPILHRSVSPSSVVIGWDGTVKLGDFGLIRMRQIVGTDKQADRDLPGLMAPEETRGERPDVRGDVFCAALLAVRLFTGRTPYSRFKGSAAELMLAMAEGDVAAIERTRPDMPEKLRQAIDAALEPDREKRTMTAAVLLEALRANTDTKHGKAALQKLLARWREGLEASVTPWERRASIPDDVPDEGAEGLMKPGTLALSVGDDRPSDSALIANGAIVDEPWNKREGGTVPVEELALKPTDPNTSVSRLGSIAPDALIMPLPAMRITMPELPTYGGPAVNISVRPPPKTGVFTGKVAAVVVATMFIVLIGGAFILFRWLVGGGQHH